MCFRPGGVEDSVLNCPNCGQLNPNVATECIKCGAPLDAAGEELEVAAPSTPAAPPTPGRGPALIGAAPVPTRGPSLPGQAAAPKRGPALPGQAPVVPTKKQERKLFFRCSDITNMIM